MDHYCDARSMIPLIVHVFWGWISGPWVVPIPFPAVQRALDAIAMLDFDSSTSSSASSSAYQQQRKPIPAKTTKQVGGKTWPKMGGKEQKSNMSDIPAAAPTMGPQLFLSLLLVAGMIKPLSSSSLPLPPTFPFHSPPQPPSLLSLKFFCPTPLILLLRILLFSSTPLTLPSPYLTSPYLPSPPLPLPPLPSPRRRIQSAIPQQLATVHRTPLSRDRPMAVADGGGSRATEENRTAIRTLCC